MEISAMLQFMEQRDWTITAPTPKPKGLEK